MSEVVVISLSKEELEQMVKPVGINPDRFHSVLISSGEFCNIHNLSESTLFRYISNGIITPEPRTPRGKYQFRLSEVLKFQPEKVKNRKSKHNQTT